MFIGEFLCVSGIEGGNISLARLHVGNCRVRQLQVVSGGVALLPESYRVTVIAFCSPCQRGGYYQQRDDYASSYAVHVTTSGFAQSDSQ
ncbi:hypothetical protein GFI10_16365 [Salmonella enterica subsp. diarizonae]|nr:hypothetical protein [Salmonella enterica subsp. diarizonae]EDM0974893.1 hypothetical protein [Salmonella enterica]